MRQHNIRLLANKLRRDNSHIRFIFIHMIVNIWIIFGVIDFFPGVSLRKLIKNLTKLLYLAQICHFLYHFEMLWKDYQTLLQCLFSNGFEIWSILHWLFQNDIFLCFLPFRIYFYSFIGFSYTSSYVSIYYGSKY
jgi:hypothetical protein